MEQDLRELCTTEKEQEQSSFLRTGCDYIDERLTRLHKMARLGYGKDIQAHIDTFLPAVAYMQSGRGVKSLEERKAFSKRMILGITDAPQEGKLPDLGGHIRSVMLGYRTSGLKPVVQHRAVKFPHVVADNCYVSRMLLQALPCIKRHNGKDKGDGGGYQVGLNVLMGLLLGLSPLAVKFPPFSVRVAIYTNIHRLLTCGGGKEFCEAHPMLMTMAFMEYCAYVIPVYMPAEFGTLSCEPGMSAFFSSLPVAGDVFRQETLNILSISNADGAITDACDIPWASLEKHCEAVVDKHTRACKNRLRLKKGDSGVGSRVAADVAKAFSKLPFVIPYDVHTDDVTNRVLGSELAALDANDSLQQEGCNIKALYEQVAAMQAVLRVYPLPANIIRMQLRSLRACMSVCERSALDGMTLRICVSCGLGAGGASRSLQTRGQCRLDGGCFKNEGVLKGGAKLICSHCQADTVVAVNTLGRVVSLRGQRFYLAPCCCSVQVYPGSGMEFQNEYCVAADTSNGVRIPNLGVSMVSKHTCPHQQIRQIQRPQRPRCEVCQTTSSGAMAPEMYTAVNHLTGEMCSIRLCSRHAPRADVLKLVANWAQLMEEVGKRDKPLFSLAEK